MLNRLGNRGLEWSRVESTSPTPLLTCACPVHRCHRQKDGRRPGTSDSTLFFSIAMSLKNLTQAWSQPNLALGAAVFTNIFHSCINHLPLLESHCTNTWVLNLSVLRVGEGRTTIQVGNSVWLRLGSTVCLPCCQITSHNPNTWLPPI